MSVLSFASCVSEEVGQEVTDTGTITLELYTGAGASRAEGDLIADELHEYALSHLDIFIFNEDKSKFHYERIATTDAPTGTVTLSGKKKGDFKAEAGYWVYVVANSSKTGKDMSSVENLDALKALTQTDTNIHLSGLDLPNVPQYFLMDGIAYIGGTEPTTAGTVEINDGTAAGTTVLKVNLRRAAAKVELVLSAGTNVEFYRNEYVGYYLRNLPTVTTLLADATLGANTQELVTTAKTVSDYSNGKYKGLEYEGVVYNGNGELSIVAYVYAHSWGATEQEFLAGGTSLVINVPLKYDTSRTDDVEPVEHDQSYYQIELGKDHKFERNHYYKITGTINAPGAEEYTEPITLTNMKYSAIDWTSVDVNVGGEVKPAYLKVNKEILRIYNQIQDDNITYNTDESLVFASSSPITLSIKNEDNTPTPYYINKFGVETYVDPTTYYIGATDLTDGDLAGNIQVKSDIPQNNAVRYFTLVVTNEDGLSKEILVEQYPVIYITNVLGYYSYRSDFKSTNGEVTTYESGNSPYYTAATWDDDKWSYGRSDGFFRSKVNSDTEASGKSTLNYYYWTQEGGGQNRRWVRREYKYRGAGDGGNARMYHIHVTATSEDYTVGRPRMNNDGFTDSSTDNAKLVSPSFMVASQLGATQNPDSYNQAATHCNQYVETYRVTENGNSVTKKFDDWRLPTAAEIAIIIDNQYVTNAAMDEVLAGHYYYSATGAIENSKADEKDNRTFVRCVRDAY